MRLLMLAVFEGECVLASLELASHDLLKYNHAQSPDFSELQSLADLCNCHAKIAYRGPAAFSGSQQLPYPFNHGMSPSS